MGRQITLTLMWTRIKYKTFKWSGTTQNRLTNQNYFTADFYGTTILSNLVDQTIIDNIETSLLTPIATTYSSQGNVRPC